MSDSPPAIRDDEVTRWLHAAGAGAPDALDHLARAVYDQLHRVAAGHMRREAIGHTLQTTVLVHEAFLQLARQREMAWVDRGHYYRVASRVMRQLLIDHTRRRHRAKRDGGRPVTLDSLPTPAIDEELLALDEALDLLARDDPRAAQVVELRYFTGLSIEEAAEALNQSTATVKRDWRYARAFLRRALRDAPDGDPP
jgi:RNA polymerase sigma factor (TIGR02999 family)